VPGYTAGNVTVTRDLLSAKDLRCALVVVPVCSCQTIHVVGVQEAVDLVEDGEREVVA
jgi:hypothetical protein